MRLRRSVRLLLAGSLMLTACGDEPSSNADAGKLDDVADAVDAGSDEGGEDTSTDAADTQGEPDADVVDPGPVDLGERLADGQVRAGVVDDANHLIGGIKADGQVGDIKLYNAQAAFIIESPRRASGYRFFGGHPVDLDIIRPAGEAGEDRFGETFLTWNMMIFQPESFEVVSDGRDGEAHVRFVGHTAPYDFAESFLRDLIDPPPVQFDIVYDYRLRPDDRALRLTVTVTNTAEDEASLDFPLLFSNHGDGAQQWTPFIGFSSPQAEWVPYFGLLGDAASYAVMAKSDDLTHLFNYKAVALTQQTTWTLAPGAKRTSEYLFLVGGPGSADLDAERRARFPFALQPQGTLQGVVDLPETAAGLTKWLVAWQGPEPVAMVPVTEDGAFSLPLEIGEYQLEVFVHRHASSGLVDVEVLEGQETTALPTVPAAGRVVVNVTDGDGAPLDGRVTLTRKAGTPTPWAPDAVRTDAMLAGNISEMAYAVGGTQTVLVPAGSYTAVASRGFSYELDAQDLDIGAGETKTLDFQVVRAVDTTGWVSADFHVHALRSPDSIVPYEVRLRQAITDDLDLPILTEHVMLSHMKHSANELGLADKLVTLDAQEVTTFEYGHFNAFPLIWDPNGINMGAVYEHGQTPSALFAAIRAQNPADEVIQVNHPRGVSISSYFDYVGLDAKNDKVSNPAGWSTDWEAVEVFNGNCQHSGNKVLDDWIGLTNAGYGKTLSSGSDTHDERTPPGTPRNWLKVDYAALEADEQNLVPVVRERRMFVSCGPFVRFEATDGATGESVGLGGLAKVDDDGAITFSVNVQAPSWITVDEVRLLRNGVEIDTVAITSQDEVVRLDTVLTDTPTADAWYAVQVIGSGSLEPVSRTGPPFAMTNPIEVDVDGDGAWTPPGKQ